MDGDSNRYKSYNGNPLKPDDYANPCGLIAKAYFNDSFILIEKNEDKYNKIIEIKSDGIANEYDKKYVFKRFRNNPELLQWINVEDGIFI